jgi:hypothetical protein
VAFRVAPRRLSLLSLPVPHAAAVFGPGGPVSTPAQEAQPGSRVGPLALWRLYREYYREPMAWFGLLVFSVLLAYGGGAVMFWFHAIYLHEGGPAISPWLHWLLDSTAGFIGLTPALAILMPLAASVTLRQAAGGGRFVLLTGTAFAFITAPGPIVHNKLVGRGTWVANHVTALLGNGRPAGAPHHIPPLVDMASQVAVGLPTYIAVAALALLAMRAVAKRPATR